MNEGKNRDARSRLTSFSAQETDAFPAAPTRSTSRSSSHTKKGDAGLSRGAKIAIIAVAAIVVVLVALLGLDYAISRDTIHAKVAIGPVDVGNMSVSEASAKLNKAIEKDFTDSVVVSSGDQKWDTTADMVGASCDTTKLAQAAYKVGKGPNFFKALLDRTTSWFGGKEVPLTLEYDPLTFGSYLDVVSSKTVKPPVQSSVKIEGKQVSVVNGTDGTRVDEEQLKSLLTEAFVTSTDSCKLPIVDAPMDITPDIAAAGAKEAETMISGPAKAIYDQKSWTFEPETIGSWLSFTSTETAGDTWTYTPKVDPKKAEKNIRSTVGALGKEPKNAEFVVSGGTVTITPSQDGTGVNIAKISKDFDTALRSTDAAKRVATIEIDTLKPERTTEDAQKMGIKQKIASYTTNYSSGAVNRNTNIHRMAEALSGSLVSPGGTWSFHETGGPTTVERGFKPAGAIVDGEVTDELGGGICQVATTVFNAVYESGFPVIERSPHSRYMSSYPTGRDAAVSWRVPDLKWKNDSSNWVLLTTSYTATSITVTLWGTDPGYTVATKTGPWTNIKPPSTKEIKDPSKPEGSKSTKQGGQPGRTVVVTRTVSKNGQVIRVDTFKSVYRPVTRIVEVGTKKAATPPAAKPTPTPPPAPTDRNAPAPTN